MKKLKLRLESFEDRITPTTYEWAETPVTGYHDFHVPGCWRVGGSAPSTCPQDGDTVLLPANRDEINFDVAWTGVISAANYGGAIYFTKDVNITGSSVFGSFWVYVSNGSGGGSGVVSVDGEANLTCNGTSFADSGCPVGSTSAGLFFVYGDLNIGTGTTVTSVMPQMSFDVQSEGRLFFNGEDSKFVGRLEVDGECDMFYSGNKISDGPPNFGSYGSGLLLNGSLFVQVDGMVTLDCTVDDYGTIGVISGTLACTGPSIYVMQTGTFSADAGTYLSFTNPFRAEDNAYVHFTGDGSIGIAGNMLFFDSAMVSLEESGGTSYKTTVSHGGNATFYDDSILDVHVDFDDHDGWCDLWSCSGTFTIGANTTVNVSGSNMATGSPGKWSFIIANSISGDFGTENIPSATWRGKNGTEMWVSL